MTVRIKKAIVKYKRALKDINLSNYEMYSKVIDSIAKELSQEEQMLVVSIVFNSEI